MFPIDVVIERVEYEMLLLVCIEKRRNEREILLE